ncbi:ribonuclease like 2 isoform X2 [Micropterus dolomieu]|nr:ribonuclease like 2 isoform X2 [Micropterus dolomieu]
MNVNQCDAVIKSRGISITNSNECKETNTFIQAYPDKIKNICGSAGVAYEGMMTKSTKPFSIVVCTLKRGIRHPHCQYRGQAYTRYIVIRCEQGLPVHFERDIINLEN